MFTQQQRNEQKTLVMKYIVYAGVLLGLLLLSQTLMAQSNGDYRSNVASGNWNTAGSWQRYNGSSWVAATNYPGQAACSCEVTIRNGQSITLNVNPANAISNLVISNGSLIINGSRTLNVNGNMTVNSNGSINLAQLTLAVGGNVAISGNVSDNNVNGSLTIGGNLTVHSSGELDLERSVMTVSGNTTINGNLRDSHQNGSTTFGGNFTVSSTGTANLEQASPFTFRNGIVNNGTFNKTGTGAVTFNTNNQSIGGSNAITINGIVTVTGITLTNNNANLNLTSTDNNALTGTGAWVQGVNSVLRIAAASIGLTAGDCSANGNTVVFNRNNIQTIPSIAFRNLEVTNGNTKTLGGAVAVNGNFTIGSGTSFNPASYNFSVSGNTTIAGTFSDNNATGTSTLQAVNLSGGSMNGSADGVVVINGSLTIPTANGTIGRVALTVNGTTTIAASRTLTLNSNNGTKIFAGSVTSNGTWQSTSVTTAANLVFRNGIVNNNAAVAFNAGAATFSNGNNNQSLSGVGRYTFSGAVSISGAVTLTNNCSHTDGVTFTNTVNGTVAGSTLANATGRVIYYQTQTQPMNTGALNMTASGNTFYYSRTGIQDIKGATYHNLIIAGNNTKTLSGNVTVANDFAVNTGTTINPAANNLTVNGNATIAGTFNDNNATGTSTFQNVNLSGGSMNGSADGVVVINGSLTIPTANATIGRVVLTVNGTTTIAASRTLTLNAGGSKTFTGSVAVNGTWTSTSISAASELVFMNGIVNNNAAVAFNAGAATFSNNNQSLSGVGRYTFSGAVSISGAVTLTNNCSHTDGVTFANIINGTVANSTLANAANRVMYYSANATTQPMNLGVLNMTASGNTFYYSRNNTQTIKATTYHNLAILNGNTKSLAGSTTVNGNLSIAASTTLDLTASNHALSVRGNWNNQGTFASRSGTVTFNGSTAQTISPNTSSFYNVVFNNTAAGAAAIVLNDNVTVTNQCTMTDGIISTGSNRLIINSNNAANLSGFSSASYVNGNLRRHIANNTSTYAFPVGNELYYRADIKNNNLNGVTYIDARYGLLERHDDLDMNVNDGAMLNYISVASNMWTIDPNNAPSSGSYDIYLYTANVSGISDNEFAVVKRPTSSPDGSSWATGGGTINAAGGNGRKVSDGYALRMGLTSFSEFGIGSTEGGNPLPIQLVSFTAKLNEQKTVDLTWVTATEINNEFFTIERSVDGIDFEEILFVDGSGNSSSIITYTATDEKPLTGISYYRLKQTDYDGTYDYSEIVSVNNNKAETAVSAAKEWKVYPNPVKSGSTIFIDTENFDASVTIAVYEAATGREVITTAVEDKYDAISLGENLKAGIYLIKIIESETSVTKRIVLQ